MRSRLHAELARDRRSFAWPLLFILCTASALVVVIMGAQLTFFNDDWWFLLQRPGLESGGGLDALLAPHNGNLVALLTLSYKLLAGVFGLGSQLPFRLVMALTMAALGVLVFVFVSDRLGPIVGLAAAAVVLFLGPAWEDLLFYAAMLDLGGATAFGLAALLALEVDTPRRNALACVLLVCSISMSSAGTAFVIGSAIAIALRRRPRQVWIPGVPAVLFGLWWVFYGSRYSSGLSLHNVERLPGYVLDSASIGLASVTGLYHGGNALARGHVVGALLILALAAWLLSGRRPNPASFVLAGTALAFWCAAGATYVVGREPVASRYQLVDATLLILLMADLLRGVHLPRAALAVLSVATGLVVASNLVALSIGFAFMSRHSDYAKADLGALEIAARVVPSSFWLLQSVARDPYLSGVTAGRYLAETRAHGSSAYDTPAQLATAAPGERLAADSVLAAADRVAPQTTRDTAPVRNCRRASVGIGRPGPSLPLTPGSNVLRNSGVAPAVIGVSRFAPGGAPVYVGFIGARSSVRIRIARDSVSLPWRVGLRDATGDRPASFVVCVA